MKALAKVLLFVLAIFCTSGTWAQTTGTITGTVKDSTGAVIPGTVVSIRNEATAAQRSATTNNSGEYSFPSLEPGRYEFRFTSSDFAPLIQHATLNVTEGIAVDAVLQVSGSQQQVTVTSGEALLQTQDNTLGRVIDGTAIRNMPLATRNFTQVLALSPGTSTTLNDATALGPEVPRRSLPTALVPAPMPTMLTVLTRRTSTSILQRTIRLPPTAS